MTQQQLDAKTAKGFNVDYSAHIVSKMYLISCLLEKEVADYNDYLKEYGLANNFRNDIYAITRNFQAFNKKVMSLITPEGKTELFKDFEQLDNVVQNFTDQLEKEFFKSNEKLKNTK